MLIGGMVGHKVQDDLKIALVRLFKQRIQVRQGSEERVGIGVIANIVAKIGHRRRIDRGEPERVNAEPLQVVQFAGDPRQVSYPIAIAIEKTAWVDLINHARLPPGARLRHALMFPLSQVMSVVYHLPWTKYGSSALRDVTVGNLFVANARHTASPCTSPIMIFNDQGR